MNIELSEYKDLDQYFADMDNEIESLYQSVNSNMLKTNNIQEC